MFFKRIFYFYSLLLGCVFILFGAFWYFLLSSILFVLFVRVKSYHEKKTKKTDLMTSFILLLTVSELLISYNHTGRNLFCCKSFCHTNCHIMSVDFKEVRIYFLLRIMWINFSQPQADTNNLSNYKIRYLRN